MPTDSDNNDREISREFFERQMEEDRRMLREAIDEIKESCEKFGKILKTLESIEGKVEDKPFHKTGKFWIAIFSILGLLVLGFIKGICVKAGEYEVCTSDLVKKQSQKIKK